MKMRYDFSPNSDITNRILTSLRQIPLSDLLNLARNDKLRLKDYTLTDRSLIAEYMEDYAKLSNTSVLFYFFGTESVTPKYSPYDDKVIQFLNTRSMDELRALQVYLHDVFPNNFYLSSPDGVRGRNRIGLVLRRLPYGTLNVDSFDDLAVPEYKNLSESIFPEIKRFRESHYSGNFTFRCDSWADLATFAGVSLHWLFKLKEPLFCNTQIADEIFDYYTLMQPAQQEQFLKLIQRSVQHQINKLTNLLSFEVGN